jgi:hypothetical protein
MIMQQAPPRADAAATATIQRRYDRQASTYDLRDAPVEILAARWRRRLLGLVPVAAGALLLVGFAISERLPWLGAGLPPSAL